MPESSPNLRYLEDSSGMTGAAEQVFVPADPAELRKAVTSCAQTGTAVTVAGAGTGLTGGRVPQRGAIVSTEQFRELQILPGRARCGAGVSLRELSEAAARTGQFLGPNPTEISASIGGITSTNAGGARSFHYGAVRRHVLRMEVTFMDGETRCFERGQRVDFAYQAVRQPQTTKNSAGYYLVPDLEWVDLLAGSEGTLAIVSSVDLRLLPEPPMVLSGIIYFEGDAAAAAAVESWRGIPELRLLEYLDETALAFLRPLTSEMPGSAKAALLIEQNLYLADDEQMDLWVERLEAADADIDHSPFGYTAADRERFRAFRHLLPVTVLERVRRNGFPKYGTDYAVPLDQGRAAHAHFQAACQERMPGKYTIFGHAGDANNHINLLPETERESAICRELVHDLAVYAAGRGGTIAAEHGIGKNKRELLPLMYSGADLQAMRQVKRTLDPHWLLGQGNILLPEAS